MHRWLLTAALACAAAAHAGRAPARPDRPACVCLAEADPRRMLRHADAVFMGEVLDVRELVDSVPGIGVMRVMAARLWIGVAFKGPRSGVVEVTDLEGVSLCGVHFRPGAGFLVYASRANGRLYASRCAGSGSGPLGERGDDVMALLEARGDTLPEARRRPR